MKLVLVRHGQSEWNLANRFTGWEDVPLSEAGIQEAKEAGRKLQAVGVTIDVMHTSLLQRAILTGHYLLEVLGQLWVPEFKHWRLNERHYGALQGLNKAETAQEYGEDQVHIWRRSFDTPPPALDPAAKADFYADPRFKTLDPSVLPSAESLKDTLDRVLPYYEDQMIPQLLQGQTVLVAAHGNSLRAITMHLEDLDDRAIMDLEIPTGVPIVYDLAEDLSIQDKMILD